jgi:Flp pilus assembly protein TadB
MLMHLPTTYAQKLVAGTVKADASLNYNALIPGSGALGVDGVALDCACQPVDAAKKKKNKRISPANLDLYNQTVVDCIESSTLTNQQMQELESLWATCVSLEQQGLLTNAWYIVAIIFIILFGLLVVALLIYCIFINYTQEEQQQRQQQQQSMRRRKAPVPPVKKV